MDRYKIHATLKGKLVIFFKMVKGEPLRTREAAYLVQQLEPYHRSLALMTMLKGHSATEAIEHVTGFPVESVGD